MATFTTNYNLRKPATDDFVTVASDINASMDTIDTQMKDSEDRLDSIEHTWTSYTPVLSNWTLGNGTITGKYIQMGKTVHFRIKLTLGSTTTVSGGPSITLPVTAAGTRILIAPVLFFDTSGGTSGYLGGWAFNNNTTDLGFIRTDSSIAPSTTVPFTWATGDELCINGTYEAA